MRFKRPVLRLALDEGVPNSVGIVLKDAGHKVNFLNSNLPRGSNDLLVCAFAQLNNYILVAIDGDMKQIARGHGVGKGQFRALSLLKLSCQVPRSASRIKEAMTFIEHEWHFSNAVEGRRIFVEISDNIMKTNR